MKIIGTIKPDAFLCRPLLYPALISAMSDEGFDWRVNHSDRDGDVAIFTTDFIETWRDFDGVKVLYDYNDIEVATHERRQCLLDGSIDFLWKANSFSVPQLQNAGVFEGSVHASQIRGGDHDSLALLDEQQLDRLIWFSPELWNTYFDPFFGVEPLSSFCDRPIDVLFVGSTGRDIYPSTVAEHRDQCVDAINWLGRDVCRLVGGYRAFANARQYVEALRRAKIVVSPWGHGVSCHRDLESAALGCQVVKPALEGHEDPIVDAYVDDDFSGLAEVVDQIRDAETANDATARSRRDAMLVKRTPTMFARELIRNVIEAVTNGT